MMDLTFPQSYLSNDRLLTDPACSTSMAAADAAPLQRRRRAMLATNQAVNQGGSEMALGLWISFAGGTQEQCDALNAEMGVEENPPPPNSPKIKEFEAYNAIGG
jgi:hypothetical protein